jgi:hypothetical protein
MSDFPLMEYRDPDAPDGETALGLLQAIYKSPQMPLPTRMRAASLTLPFEQPKLSAVAYLADAQGFAAQLDRAIERSGKRTEMRVIEHQPAGQLVEQDQNGE